MACDICNKKGTTLTNLRDCYQTEEIKSICPECESVVNKQQEKIMSVTWKINMQWMKEFMTNLVKEKQ